MYSLRIEALSAIQHNPTEPARTLVESGWDWPFAVASLGILQSEELAIQGASGWYLTARGRQLLHREPTRDVKAEVVNSAVAHLNSAERAIVYAFQGSAEEDRFVDVHDVQEKVFQLRQYLRNRLRSRGFRAI